MKKNFLWIFSFALLGLAVMTTTYSCDPDPCADVVCVNADCFEGDCICQVGFVKDANGDCVPSCDDANCPPNSACDGNECVCDTGFENDANGDCVLERMKFMGAWTSRDTCDQSGSDFYAITVTAGINDDQILLNNFYDVDPAFAPIATIVGTFITIDRQDPLGTLIFIEGTGTMENGQVTLSYTLSDEDPADPFTDICTSIWTR